jgi:hypothetical protein
VSSKEAQAHLSHVDKEEATAATGEDSPQTICEPISKYSQIKIGRDQKEQTKHAESLGCSDNTHNNVRFIDKICSVYKIL